MIRSLIDSRADFIALMVMVMQDAFASTWMFHNFSITPDDEVCVMLCSFRYAGSVIDYRGDMGRRDADIFRGAICRVSRFLQTTTTS